MMGKAKRIEAVKAIGLERHGRIFAAAIPRSSAAIPEMRAMYPLNVRIIREADYRRLLKAAKGGSSK